MRGPQLLQSIVTLQTEHENLRATLRWSIEHDDADVGLRTVGALWRFWHLAGHLSEGRHWTAAVLDLPSAAGRTVARAKALSAAGGLAYWQGDVAAVRAAYEEAAAICEELGDEASRARATYDLAFAYGLVPTKAHSRRLFEASREMFERVGNAVGAADTLWALAMMAGLAGDYAAARDLADDSVQRHRELGDAFGLVDALSELGRATRELGEFDTARSCFLEALHGTGSHRLPHRRRDHARQPRGPREPARAPHPCPPSGRRRRSAHRVGRWPGSPRVRRPPRPAASRPCRTPRQAHRASMGRGAGNELGRGRRLRASERTPLHGCGGRCPHRVMCRVKPLTGSRSGAP